MKLEVTGNSFLRSLLVTAALTFPLLGATAQAPSSPDAKSDTKPSDAKTTWTRPKPDTYEAFYLVNSPRQNDLNDLQTAMRNMMPNSKIYGVPSQQAIVVYATQEDLVLARKLMADLDKKKATYRLTYTLTESDGGKKLSSQHYALVAITGERAIMKQGNRFPIVTGKADETANASTQVQYVDVGLTIEVSLESVPESLRLHSKIDQSGVSEEKSSVGAQDPVIHQSSLDSNATLVPGKALVLGSLDVPGGSRHIDVEVVADLVK
jgi:type II secretory pathway component GspD/PulD (secretin)